MLNPRTSISAQPRSFGFVFLGRLPRFNRLCVRHFPVQTHQTAQGYSLSLDALSSALSLLVALVGRADHHDLALSFDHLAFIAHGLYARSNFHFDFLLIEIGINPCFSK